MGSSYIEKRDWLINKIVKSGAAVSGMGAVDQFCDEFNLKIQYGAELMSKNSVFSSTLKKMHDEGYVKRCKVGGLQGGWTYQYMATEKGYALFDKIKKK